MVLNIITDDFENFYEIQDDLGRLVNHFIIFFSLVYYLFDIDNEMNLVREIDILNAVYFLWVSSDCAIEKQKTEYTIILQTINKDTNIHTFASMYLL